jgi:hypothetical protein
VVVLLVLLVLVDVVAVGVESSSDGPPLLDVVGVAALVFVFVFIFVFASSIVVACLDAYTSTTRIHIHHAMPCHAMPCHAMPCHAERTGNQSQKIKAIEDQKLLLLDRLQTFLL